MLTNDQINSIAQAVAVAVAHTLSDLLGQKAAAQPKAAPVTAKPKAAPVAKPVAKPVAAQPKASPQISKRHAAIIAGFKRLGVKDPKLFVDIKPYKLWLEAGRQVQPNAKSVSGMFHISQTRPVTA